jgi:hypothetical protein
LFEALDDDVIIATPSQPIAPTAFMGETFLDGTNYREHLPESPLVDEEKVSRVNPKPAQVEEVEVDKTEATGIRKPREQASKSTVANTKKGEEEQAAKASQPGDRSSFAVHDHVVSSIEHYEFDLQIVRDGNEQSSWEDEQQLFLEDPQTVVRYWETVEGGREEACSGMWKIYKIFDEREAGDETTYLVGWIGSLDRGWELRRMLLTNARSILADWEEKQATKRAKEEGSDYEFDAEEEQ